MSSSCCWTENRAFSLSAFSFLEPGFVKGVERTVLTEALLTDECFSGTCVPVPVWARAGGAAAYLFQMNYRGLLSYNGIFVSKSSIPNMSISNG